MHKYLGEIAALLAAICWTSTAILFEITSRKIGSVAVNILRLIFAFIILCFYTFITRGLILPVDATSSTWFWLGISGIIGLFIGDIFLFEAFALISSRVAMLIMSFVPLLTVFFGWFIIDEKLTIINILGILLTVSGVLVVAFHKNEDGKYQLKSKFSKKGLIFAFIGAIGQSMGIIFSKIGIGNYDAFASNQVRMIIALPFFILITTYLKKWKDVKQAFYSRRTLGLVVIASILGPFAGITLSLIAVQNTTTAIASTLMALVPVLILFPSVIFLKQKIKLLDIIGAIISFIGVTLFFL